MSSREQLLDLFDRNAAGLREAVANCQLAGWQRPWTMRRGEQVIVTRPRSTVYRVFSFNHLIHHRGQLCVYLRLLNVPVPAVYFNSADTLGMIFD